MTPWLVRNSPRHPFKWTLIGKFSEQKKAVNNIYFNMLYPVLTLNDKEGKKCFNTASAFSCALWSHDVTWLQENPQARGKTAVKPGRSQRTYRLHIHGSIRECLGAHAGTPQVGKEAMVRRHWKHELWSSRNKDFNLASPYPRCVTWAESFTSQTSHM